jgi:predicted GNAT family acetyltransferase
MNKNYQIAFKAIFKTLSTTKHPKRKQTEEEMIIETNKKLNSITAFLKSKGDIIMGRMQAGGSVLGQMEAIYTELQLRPKVGMY